MTIQCPECASENVVRLNYETNDFICDDCGVDFEADDDGDFMDNKKGKVFPLTPEIFKEIIAEHKKSNTDPFTGESLEKI